jgi:hypothetical protein
MAGRSHRAVLGLWVACVACTGATESRAPSRPTAVERPVDVADQGDAPPEVEPDLEAMALACDGAGLAQVLATLDAAEIAALAKARRGSSARLLLGWEATRSFTDEGALVPSAVSSLVAALTEELGTAPPTWWVEHLASGRRISTDRRPLAAYDVGATDAGDRRGPWHEGPGRTVVRPQAATSLTADGDTLAYDLGIGRVALGPLPPEAGAAIEITRARAGTTLYYAAFSRGAGGFRFPLHAVGPDGTTWTAEVCGPDRQILGGLGYLTVQIVPLEPPPAPGAEGHKQTSGALRGIAVFTAESHGVALDVFDAGSGTRTLAWSSDLWFATPPP